MTYASLLVAVEVGEESDSRVELACDLAIAFDALLIGLSAGAITSPLYDPIAGGAMLGELLTLYRDMAEADVERARLRFTELTTDRALETEWRGGVGDPAEFVSRAARAADLVILGGRNPRAPGHAPDVADVLMGCGRPVLVTPPTRERSPVGNPALVAWKDCREARRALAGALPLLQRASSVTLFSVCTPEENEHADGEIAEVVRYLARHEIHAEPVIALAGEQPTGRQILDEAMAREAGLIVAGAYGHSRLREWALGGVTRSLIADGTVCLALAH
ncbi:MAG: universal stress protein [Brevundimonas sp.]|uniref:universal stress protein n=1 Tax=Brevundimonas sp. TaxID=1871086 RepID=UPI00272209D0|nr:universal stress protein [Brevundimonas sp.]MDO9587288.1 universal stress protein [Brevundimonas sp.]MDP3369909.1 universal stress protein [Brevundimonas sp.]MDP3658162.1 universal stress protein [Brevundimonas sp.]MDZ4110625.1 universal stress protein [Brevundimonas sp.]